MIGPGEYVPAPTEGITRPEDLPLPRVLRRRRVHRQRPCPRCGHKAARYALDTRRLFDLGDRQAGCPRRTARHLLPPPLPRLPLLLRR